MTKANFSAALRGAVAALSLLATLSCGEERATDVLGPSDNAQAAVTPGDLVECPTSQTLTTQALVTPLGGTVTLGNTSITIPSGALVLPTLIRITIPASRYVEVDVTANALTSFIFNTPVKITVDYSRCTRTDIDRAPLSVWYIDSATKEPLQNMGGVDDKVARSVTFETGHLSGYAIAF